MSFDTSTETRLQRLQDRARGNHPFLAPYATRKMADGFSLQEPTTAQERLSQLVGRAVTADPVESVTVVDA